MRSASGNASANSEVPPITKASAAFAAARHAPSSDSTTVHPGARYCGLRDTTMLSRPGSALPIDSNVRRPMITGCPIVTSLK